MAVFKVAPHEDHSRDVLRSYPLCNVREDGELIVVEAHRSLHSISELRSEDEHSGTSPGAVFRIDEGFDPSPPCGDRSCEGVAGDSKEVVAFAVVGEALWTFAVRIVDMLEELLAALHEVVHLDLATPRLVVVDGVHEVVTDHILGTALEVVLSCQLVGDGSILDASSSDCCEDRDVVGMLDVGVPFVLHGDSEVFGFKDEH
mmetsp:Transcript_9930/g.27141  ORF Transcript_9930/g.27141 Transcript_9930/m.27141 type:complete len:202 (-) Transcript_9930:618-1223(-)